MTFIDAHVHIFPETALGRVNPRFGGEYAPYGFLKLPGGGYHVMPPYIHDTQFTADTLVHMMDVYGVKQAVIQQSILNEQNAVVAEAVARYPHRLSGSMILEPGANWQADLLHWKKAGLNSNRYTYSLFHGLPRCGLRPSLDAQHAGACPAGRPDGGIRSCAHGFPGVSPRGAV